MSAKLDGAIVMKCSKAQELFSSYLENTIQPPMAVALEQHLTECDRCKAEYGRFHATTVVLDELPEVEPPADLHAMIMARIKETRQATPARVKWWNIDWQSALTVRVPAKAIAGAAAVLLVFAVLTQFGPLHTVTANFVGAPRAAGPHIDDGTTVPAPLPTGFRTDSSANYISVGAGLSVGVRVDSQSASSTLYVMRLATSSATPVPLRVSILPRGVGSEEMALYKGSVSRDEEARVPVVVTRSPEQLTSDVAVIQWENGGQMVEEYVFLPSTFASFDPTSERAASISASGEGALEFLDRISAEYGAVILAPGKTVQSEERISVVARSIGAALGKAGMTSEMAGASVYVIE